MNRMLELHVNSKALTKDIVAWMQENNIDPDDDYQIPVALIERNIFYVEKLEKPNGKKA